MQQFRGRNKWLIVYKGWKGYVVYEGHGKRGRIVTVNIKCTLEKPRGQRPTQIEMQVKTQNRLHVNADG